MTSVSSATNQVASKTGTFKGELEISTSRGRPVAFEITNAKDMRPNVTVEASKAPSVTVNPAKVEVSPTLNIDKPLSLDVSKPLNIAKLDELIAVQAQMRDNAVNSAQQVKKVAFESPLTLENFDKLVKAQESIKEYTDEKAKIEAEAHEFAKERVKREEEAHEILKEEADYKKTAVAIRDMDGTVIKEATPRDMALTYEASLARTYTDENTTTVNDLDFDLGIDAMGIFNGFRGGLSIQAEREAFSEFNSN
ncbi:hypothetical protein CIG11343_0590 [Campylobacter iguaniorum]|uniref:hypothetical protein n=1 Tax=Campylobacter iguaniorum TaxID=1244531 RepID=UPI0007C89A25|nr:hypothetical protein [Campylobacter iguaniorum]ANE35651.1 hypothetical protein CIG11343_0590 [Campylobacter iguaniorum]